MANHPEDVLREKTHKGQTDTTYQRVFYTLHGEGEDRAGEAHRVAKAVSRLIDCLQQKELISETDVDDILMDVI